jgi:hypothetical protein
MDDNLTRSEATPLITILDLIVVRADPSLCFVIWALVWDTSDYELLSKLR